MSQADWDVLDHFLPAARKTIRGVEGIDGFFTALQCAPHPVPAGEAIWAVLSDGAIDLARQKGELDRLSALLTRLWKRSGDLLDGLADYQPILARGPLSSIGQAWAIGFREGMKRQWADWQRVRREVWCEHCVREILSGTVLPPSMPAGAVKTIEMANREYSREEWHPSLGHLVTEVYRVIRHPPDSDYHQYQSWRRALHWRVPRPELLGLTLSEADQLTGPNWLTTGALQLNRSLGPALLEGSSFLHNAQALLGFVEAHQPVPLTRTGNLTRKTVASLLDRLRLPPNYMKDHWSVSRVVNEVDVWPLHHARVILARLGFLKRRKGLWVSPEGRRFRVTASPGELLTRAFEVYFEVMAELSVRGPDPGSLLAGVGVALYRLSEVGTEWITAEALGPLIWLPEVVPIRDWERIDGGALGLLTSWHLLWPLVDLGLMEIRSAPGDGRIFAVKEFRVTPLFRKLLHFRFEEDPAEVRARHWNK